MNKTYPVYACIFLPNYLFDLKKYAQMLSVEVYSKYVFGHSGWFGSLKTL